MGKMSQISLSLEAIQQLCETAPSPLCLASVAYNTLQELDRRVNKIHELAKEIEDLLSNTGDVKLPD